MREIKTLKLNVTNIKSTLISGNKALKKLRSDEKIFSRNQQTRSKRIGKESFVEGKIPGSGMVGGVLQKMAAPAMSLIDKIKEFIGTVLLGIIVNNLPSIIRRVQEFLEKYKWVFDTLKNVLKVTGDLFMVLIDIFNYFNPKKEELKKEREELEKKLADFIGATDETGKELDQTEKEVSEFVTESKKNEVVEDVIETIRQSSTTSTTGSKPITKKQFVTRASQYTRAKTSGGITAPITVPGIGTYQRTSPRGFLGRGEVEVATDTSGNKMDPKDFDKKFNTMIGSQNLIFETLKSEGIQGYASGGYVDTNRSKTPSKPRQGMTGGEKIAKSSAGTFLDLKDTVYKQESILDVKESSYNSIKELTTNFKSYLDLTKDKKDKKDDEDDKKPKTPKTPSTSPKPTSSSEKPEQLAGIDPGSRIVGYVGSTGESTGPHIHIETGQGRPGQGGREIPSEVLSNIIVGGKPLSDWTRTAGLGDDRNHQGFDYGGVGINGKPIQLRGGLRYIDYDTVQDPKGYGNNIVIQDRNGNFYILGHLSAGPESVEQFRQRQIKEAPNSENKLDPGKQGPVIEPKGGPIVNIPGLKVVNKSEKYGKGGLDMLTQYYDGEGMSEVIIINSTQPIIVPMRR